MDKTEKFLKVFCFELDDLLEDVYLMRQLLKERHERKEVTDYVFMENMAVFSRELEGIREVLSDMKEFHPQQMADLQELKKAICHKIQERLQQHDLPEAVMAFCQRKIDKVHDFIKTVDS